jgi:YjbE family integral membrane protein
MDLVVAEFLTGLAAIVVIDLVLAGDNAVVIALAARGLPEPQRSRAIAWGALGAIAVRCAMTLVVVWLLQVPGLMAAGGALLAWIAWKLLAPRPMPEGAGAAAITLRSALQTIVVADAAMGLDNVLAIAGIAHGSFVLVLLGLAISVPIVVWGSTLIIRWIERYPGIVNAGVVLLGATAARMIVEEPLLKEFFDAHPGAEAGAYASIIGGIFGAGHIASRRLVADRA